MWINKTKWETLNNRITGLSLELAQIKKFLAKMESKCLDKKCPDCPEKQTN